MEENEEKKEDKRKRINVGAHIETITPFTSLMAGAIVAIVTWMNGMRLIPWIILVLATLVLFLFIGSIIQMVVERAVQKVEDREAEERRLRLIAAEQEMMDTTGMENQPVEPDMTAQESVEMP